MMTFLQACEVLGITSEASKTEARRAYRQLAQICHPDKGGDSEQFKRVNEAHRVFQRQYASARIIRGGFGSAPARKKEEKKPRRESPLSPEQKQFFAERTRRAERKENRSRQHHQALAAFLLIGFFLAHAFLYEYFEFALVGVGVGAVFFALTRRDSDIGPYSRQVMSLLWKVFRVVFSYSIPIVIIFLVLKEI